MCFFFGKQVLPFRGFSGMEEPAFTTTRDVTARQPIASGHFQSAVSVSWCKQQHAFALLFSLISQCFRAVILFKSLLNMSENLSKSGGAKKRKDKSPVSSEKRDKTSSSLSWVEQSAQDVVPSTLMMMIPPIETFQCSTIVMLIPISNVIKM